MKLSSKILSDKHLSFLAVLMAVEAARSREAEASVVVNNPGVMKIYDTNKAPNERIKIVDDADHGELMVDQRSGEIKYSPDHLGMADTFEYDLVSDGMCANFLMCPPVLVLIAAVAGGISRYRDKLDCPEAKGLDFGDAPDSFQTVVASDGARHVITPGVILGHSRDADQDGLPSENANGDDEFDGSDDENGLVIDVGTYEFGENIPVELIIGGAGSGFVSMWADFNLNGEFDEGEIIEWVDGPEFLNHAVFAGYSEEGAFRVYFPEEMEFPEPGSEFDVYVRVRVANDEVVDVPYGLITSGEVEDYRVTVVANYDLGDLPEFDEVPSLQVENAEFPVGESWYTTFGEGGAAHLLNGTLRLGSDVDADDDGEPTYNADGDDDYDSNDDEDGVTFFNRITGEGAILPTTELMLTVGDEELKVEAQEYEYDNWVEVDIQGDGEGYLNGWIDFNNDNLFSEDEQVFDNVHVEPGDLAVHSFDFPTSLFGPESVYSRFRVSDQELSSPNGTVLGGEVEDHLTPILQRDFGDLPQDFLYGEFDFLEASHIIVDGVYLGEIVDPNNFTPSPYYNYNTADGDDVQFYDDDDGVYFNPGFEFDDLEFAELNGYSESHGFINMGELNIIQVEVGPAGGYLYAWLDNNLNEQFDEDELIIDTPYALSPGIHYFPVFVETSFSYNEFMYSRFRITSEQQNDPSPGGLYNSGEVEDYSTYFDGFMGG